jgi:hypothetical protein
MQVMERTGIVPFKEREVADGQRVHLYLNLHKSVGKAGAIEKPWYSLRCPKSGQILAHADHVTLRNARFVVSDAGREKVRLQRRKNVHAWIEGEVVLDGAGHADAPEDAVQLFYDPYKVERFVIAGTPCEVHTAQMAFIDGPGVLASL